MVPTPLIVESEPSGHCLIFGCDDKLNSQNSKGLSPKHYG